jgi:hypothetical protein
LIYHDLPIENGDCPSFLVCLPGRVNVLFPQVGSLGFRLLGPRPADASLRKPLRLDLGDPKDGDLIQHGFSAVLEVAGMLTSPGDMGIGWEVVRCCDSMGMKKPWLATK